MANADKIRKVVTLALTSKAHDQHQWMESDERDANHQMTYPLDEIRMNEGSCLTSACLAGYTAVEFTPAGTQFNSLNSYLYFADGTHEAIDDWAERELGLTHDQAYFVFRCMNNEAAIKRLAYVAEHPDATGPELAEAIPEHPATY